MSLEWNRLRSLDGSVELAFEELCSQLASNEEQPPESFFFRSGRPDGGIECYWTLPNGQESGWQAKYFTDMNSASHWAQIDASVKEALNTHPKLINLTICLAMDLPNGKVDKRKSAKEKWDGYVAKWEKNAKEKGMPVRIHYWGNSEIWKRLSREENRGCYYFWFNSDLFTKSWFRKNVDIPISNAGDRYSPKIGVELPIRRYFDSLGRTPAFTQYVGQLYDEMQIAYDDIDFKKLEQQIGMSTRPIRAKLDELLKFREAIRRDHLASLPLKEIQDSYMTIEKTYFAWIEALSKKLDKYKTNGAGQTHSIEEEQVWKSSNEILKGRLHALYLRLTDLYAFSINGYALSADRPMLIISGSAGAGKTHLFCDVAKQRVESGLPTILLLGGHFIDDEPWNQIIRILGLKCTTDEFLGALNTAAHTSGSKCLILIDALNEGKGKVIWDKYLAGVLKALKDYPELAISVSVRSSYKPVVIPRSLDSKYFLEVIHEGFSGHEIDATKVFFDCFNIERPAIPLLNPEFTNPLFLKLFCEAIRNNGERRIPSGIQGISAILEYYIKSIDMKLSREDYLDYDQKLKIVRKAIFNLSSQMAYQQKPWIEYEEAKRSIDSIWGGREQSKSLFHHLLSEGVISEDIYWDESNKPIEIIRFTYERFSDHLIIKSMFDLNGGCNAIEDLFVAGLPLFEITKNNYVCQQNQGLIESLSIQIPERYGKELFDVIPQCVGYDSVREAFINSIAWRSSVSFTESSTEFINEHILSGRDELRRNLINSFIDAILLVTANKHHPYNADHLHKWLSAFSLADRDSIWTTYLQNRYTDGSSLKSLIDWAWFSDVKTLIDDETRRLYGIVLAWFLSSSNRNIRDTATKALVSLFTNHINILHIIIKEFLSTNDPYVLERLFAVAYGCVLRSNDTENIALLTKDTYNWIFEGKNPPPNILLRDYARGIIEFSTHNINEPNIDMTKVRPPYGSGRANFDLNPKLLKKIEKEIKKECKGVRGAEEIYNSVMGFSDFARYIIGTDAGSFKWSSRKLWGAHPSMAERYMTFVNSLSSTQKKEWDLYQECCNAKIFGNESKDGSFIGITVKNKYSVNTIQMREKKFLKTLNQEEKKTYEKYVVPYLNNASNYWQKERFDMNLARRWILKRVFELGWTKERFENFDEMLISINNHQYIRGTNKPERIGKKYLWIAYFEFLAKVSDNYKLKLDNGRSLSRPCYEGPWQTRSRDIDPSFILTKTVSDYWPTDTSTNCWWFNEKYRDIENEVPDSDWLKAKSLLPEPKKLTEVVCPRDHSVWLNLNCLFQWRQNGLESQYASHNKRRELFYLIHGYLVKDIDSCNVFKWAMKQDYSGRWMPDPWDFYNIFLGEFVKSPAYVSTTSEGYHEWTLVNDKIPFSIHNPCMEYNWSAKEYDCSIEEGISIRIPSASIIRKMGLEWCGKEGRWYDHEGDLVAFDPSVTAQGPSSLLINKDKFITFLKENKLGIFWALLGEKNIITGRPPIGRLFISGAYSLTGNVIDGNIKTKYEEFKDKEQ